MDSQQAQKDTKRQAPAQRYPEKEKQQAPQAAKGAKQAVPQAAQQGQQAPAKAVQRQDQQAPVVATDKKGKLMQLSEISLQLDTYDNIFSDFDPRPFSQRAISEDFLFEAQRASRESGKGTVSLKLLMPTAKRKESDEAMIKRRLKEHFKKHSIRIENEIKEMVKKGVIFAVLGTAIMLAAALVLFFYATTSILSSFLVVFLEPAGWFFFWEGLYQIIFESKKLRPNLEFYKKMAKCEMAFLPY